MADTKISDLSAKAVPVAADSIAIVDSSDTSSKKCTFTQLFTGGTAWTVGKTAVNWAFAGTVSVAEAFTVTTGGATITAGGLTVTAGGATITAGGLTVSDGTTALTDDSNTAASFIVQNDTATTLGNGTTEDKGVVVFSSDTLTTGTLARLQLDESALTTGLFVDCIQTDAPASVFSIAENGIMTIAGTAGSNSIILTTGDVSVADGSITVADADNAATLSVTNNTATSESPFVFAGSGTFTGSTTKSFMTLTPSGLTSGTALYVPAAAITSGKIAHLVAGTTLVDGQAVVISTASTALTSGQLLNLAYAVSGETVGDKTGQLVDITASIDYTKATGTVAGDFDLVSIIKTSTNTTAGGTHTETGSVLYIGNVVTQTAGTMTDTTVGIEISMDADGTGDGIKLTHAATAGKAINITSSATDAAGVVLVTASSLVDGTALKLVATEATLTTGLYIQCYDGAANDFSVGKYGATIIAGNASGTDALTLTAGDLTLTSGDVTLTAGSLVLTLGDATLTEGDLTLTLGSATLTAGDFTMTLGDAELVDGSLTITDADDAATLSVTNDTATTASPFVFAGSGTFTGSTTTSFMTITPSGLTTGTAVYLPLAALSEGKGLHITSGATQTTGSLLYVQDTGADCNITTGTIASFDMTATAITSTVNKIGSGLSVTSSRTTTSGAVADDYDLASIIRTSIINGAGSMTAAGSVLYIGNVVTNSSGTVTDTTNGIEIVMDADGTGDGVKITHPAITGKALNVVSSATTAAGVILVTADALTSGQMLKLSTSATAIATTGRIFLSNHSGATGTSAVLNEFASAANDETTVLRVSASDVLAGGVLLDLSGAAVTTGVLLDSTDANAISTGQVISIASSSTAIATTGRLFLSAHSGATTTSGVLNEFSSTATDETVIVKITASAALAAGAALEISAAAMTTGSALKIEGADALTDGDLVSLESDSADASARALIKMHNNNAAAVGTAPIEIVNDAVIDSHFYIMFELGGVTFYKSDGTTANGALSGTAGDICINAGTNKPEYCTGTTNWTALV